MYSKLNTLIPALIILSSTTVTNAELTLPAIFGDHMVLQQNQSNRVWGWAEDDEKIEVEINGQSHSTKANNKGRWEVTLRPIPVGGPYRMEIEGESSEFFFDDVLVGEVWICSGQSNMAWTVRNSYNAEVEIATAKYPKIRLISVPQVGTQKAQNDFKGPATK